MVKRAQTIRWPLATKSLSVFDHFVGLALKGLIKLMVYQYSENSGISRN